MNITIRKSTRLDIPQIYNMVKQLAVYEKEPEAVTATLNDYYLDWDANIFQVLVAEREKVVVGIAIYYMTYSTWKGKMLYLEDFVIDQKFRKLGIGQLLFDAFLKEAKSLDAKLVKWQVLDWNQPAIQFSRQVEIRGSSCTLYNHAKRDRCCDPARTAAGCRLGALEADIFWSRIHARGPALCAPNVY